MERAKRLKTLLTAKRTPPSRNTALGTDAEGKMANGLIWYNNEGDSNKPCDLHIILIAYKVFGTELA